MGGRRMSSMTDEELLKLCELPEDSAADVLALLRTAARLLEQWSQQDSCAGAAVTMAAAMGRAGHWSVRSLPFGYEGPSIRHEGWIKRDDLALKLTQLGGLIGGRRFTAMHADTAIAHAIQEYWLREGRHDGWRPGMESGSGWKKVVQAQPVGLARATELAESPPAMTPPRASTTVTPPALAAISSLPPPAPLDPSLAPNGDEPRQDPALKNADRLTLLTLAVFDPSILASAAQIAEAMDPSERLSERTITPAIRKLVELGLAERPEGERQGARLTLRGRRLASKIAD